MFIDFRDSAHNNSFMSIALILNHKKDLAESYFYPVINILFKDDKYWIKNPTFTFKNAEGWRQWLYENLLIDYNYNPYCGTSFDNLEPTMIYAMITDKSLFIDKITSGLIYKFGLLGNNLEHIILRPRVLSIIFRNLNFRLGYWIMDIFENIIPLEKYPNTTRTIRDYIYLIMVEKTLTETIWSKLLKYRHRNTDWKKVFEHYFSNESNNIIAKEFKWDYLKK